MKALKRNLLQRRLVLSDSNPIVTSFSKYLDNSNAIIDYLDATQAVKSFTRLLPARTLLRQLVNEAYNA